MYTPRAFQETDNDRLHAIMRDNGFALLLSSTGDVPLATHLPVALETFDDGAATLIGHMAKANPHWRALEANSRALAVFSGPHAYVSPSWYETGPAVPTWNYVAVHAHGDASVVEDAAEIEAIVSHMTAIHEDGRPTPWRFAGLPGEFRTRQIKGIVGFRMPIDRLEGKIKLSQNRPAADAARVAAILTASPDQTERETATAMRHFGVVGRNE